MTTKCYIIEWSTENETLFEQLDEYGFDYYCEEHWPAPGYMEIYVDCYVHEIQELEEIMKWYV